MGDEDEEAENDDEKAVKQIDTDLETGSLTNLMPASGSGNFEVSLSNTTQHDTTPWGDNTPYIFSVRSMSLGEQSSRGVKTSVHIQPSLFLSTLPTPDYPQTIFFNLFFC